MSIFGKSQTNEGDNNWRRQLDGFVTANQTELAALAWGLFLRRGDSDQNPGIDLHPKPHFIYYPKAALEELDRNIEGQVREILGILENHDPRQEVLFIAIGKGQLKLINFAPQPSPPECYGQLGKDVDALLEVLEERMGKQITG